MPIYRRGSDEQWKDWIRERGRETDEGESSLEGSLLNDNCWGWWLIQCIRKLSGWKNRATDSMVVLSQDPFPAFQRCIFKSRRAWHTKSWAVDSKSVVGKGYTDISTILEWYSSQSAQLVTTIVEIILWGFKIPCWAYKKPCSVYLNQRTFCVQHYCHHVLRVISRALVLLSMQHCWKWVWRWG